MSDEPDAGPEADDEAMLELAAGLRAVIARLGRRLNPSASVEGLTPSQASALQVLSHRGSLRLSELAGIEGLNPTMLSRIVGKLDEGGLIHRIPDPADQRAIQVEATEEGHRVAGEIRNARSRVVAEALAKLPEPTREMLRDTLSALVELDEALSQTP